MSRHKKKNKKVNQDTAALNTSEIRAEEEKAGSEVGGETEELIFADPLEDGEPEEVSEETVKAPAEEAVPEAAASDEADTAAASEGAVEGSDADPSGEAPAESITEETENPGESDSDSISEEEIVTEEAINEESASEENTPDEESGDASEETSEDAGEEKKGSSEKSRVSRNALREQTENERIRREARHKKRIRQQVTAYIILFLIIAVIGLGLYFGIRYFVNRSRAIKEAQAAAELELQQQLEEEANAQAEPEPVPEVHTVEELGDTPLQLLDAEIEAEISQMTLEEKVQGIMFITPESITGVDRVVIAGDGTAAALSDFCPGGIVYSSRNVNATDQFATMVSNTANMVSRPVFFATSETGLNESGLVGTGAVENVMTPAQAAESGDVEAVVANGMAIGTGLSAVGIGVDFAPVADLAVTAGGIGENSTYGSDASTVTPYVTAMADGLSQGGVVAAYKYFPSLAASSQDPKNGRALCDRSIEDFRACEFQVWLSAINAGAQMIQMSNVIYPSIDNDSLPSTLSEKTVTGVLRDELKYDGVIISGPLSDAAITEYYTPGDSAVMALKAGCDMIYSSPQPRAAVEGIIESVANGVVSEDRIDDALIRIYRIRYAARLEELRAQYEADALALGVDLTGITY
ncbi:MAG: hypothetical protein K6F65_05870 [Lachnospiraceae bacterium]|nr:hypothetical protein [Lachnospiraceae bacterium]